MFTQTTGISEEYSNDCYQLIKDEHLRWNVVSAQILAGSRILLSTYQHVVFSDCNFFACEFQGVTFENCVFENCTFEFSHFRKTKFKNCNFTNCTWKASSTINSIYEDCTLPARLEELCQNGNNLIAYPARDFSLETFLELASAA